MRIGIAVEGESDRIFIDKIVKKNFRNIRFDIRQMSNKYRLIRQSPQLYDDFKSGGYSSAVAILDLDNDPCVTAAIEGFSREIMEERRLGTEKRFFHICVSKKEIEAWYLADIKAINKLIPGIQWTVPDGENTDVYGARKLDELHRNAGLAYRKIPFAKKICVCFDPCAAIAKSTSFKYFWTTLGIAAGK
jgi:hypothetical protein